MRMVAAKRRKTPVLRMTVVPFCAAATLAAIGLVSGVTLPATVKFTVGLALFAVLATAFVLSRERENVSIFEYPVFITLLAFVQLALAPLFLFVRPGEMEEFVTEDGLVRALFLCIIGMICFWAGTMMFRRARETNSGHQTLLSSDNSPGDSSRLTIIACILFAIGSTARTYLLTRQMYGYVASDEVMTAQLGLVSTLSFLSRATIWGLLIMAIEKYSSPENREVKAVFWIMLVIQFVWGLISGMKGETLVNLVIVAAACYLCTRRLPWKWVLIPPLLLIILYPLNNAYRQLVRWEGHQVDNLESAVQVGNAAVDSHSGMSGRSFLSKGLEDTLSRMNGLTSITQLMSIGPHKALLEGQERLWMIPIYPFVPRLLWKDKPTLYKGRRFSALLGGDPLSSTALTYPGDCYVMGGWGGVVVGMFLWGVFAEGLVQFFYRKKSKGRLFIYVMFAFSSSAPPVEATVFGLWTSVLQQSVTLGALAIVIYGYDRRVFVRGGALRDVHQGRVAY